MNHWFLLYIAIGLVLIFFEALISKNDVDMDGLVWFGWMAALLWPLIIPYHVYKFGKFIRKIFT